VTAHTVFLDFLLIQPDLHIGRSGDRLRLAPECTAPLMVIKVFQNSGA
jgi:hypothetical protein